MDLSSTGSSISKYDVEEAFLITDVEESKLDETKQTSTPVEEEKIELPKKKEAAQELTIDDFIDDFKL